LNKSRVGRNEISGEATNGLHTAMQVAGKGNATTSLAHTRARARIWPSRKRCIHRVSSPKSNDLVVERVGVWICAQKVRVCIVGRRTAFCEMQDVKFVPEVIRGRRAKDNDTHDDTRQTRAQHVV
jgi:hypothetical protein